MQTCPICKREAVITLNFGGSSCNGCAAFFRRSVRGEKDYKCKNVEKACTEMAIVLNTAIHACKKCRFDRCVKEGMKRGCVRDPTAQKSESEEVVIHRPVKKEELPDTPILNQMADTMRIVLRLRKDVFGANNNQIKGTSEPGTSYHTYKNHQRNFVSDVALLRKIFDFAPILCDLSDDHKEAMVKNSMVAYVSQKPILKFAVYF
ncbi:hypothetical protein L596_020875 [Steinernema carpocapsae]|uniref:Nuclear receptor domain-containing protein n=1 Tax=Steinernema carpocapsae TaxID=34508 RepID=A0A4U5MUS5_STECR|nr:hypothetical protein L596_020875 [Steinernema carpocapsae]